MVYLGASVVPGVAPAVGVAMVLAGESVVDVVVWAAHLVWVILEAVGVDLVHDDRNHYSLTHVSRN